MPKGGYNNSNRSGGGRRISNEKFDDHNSSKNFLRNDRDRRPGGDLTVRKGANRRVSFKTQSRQNNAKLRNVELGLRNVMEEDDEMIERRRRRGSPIPKSARGGKGQPKLIESTSGWFQVTIPFGQKYDKEFLLKSLLQAISPEIFIPHYWKEETSNIVFYVDDYKMARALQNVDRKIDLPNGFKMMVKVRNGLPSVTLDINVRESIKIVMAKRYNPNTKALDLSAFHADPDLRDIFVALFRPTIMIAAIDIIEQNIPDLEALNLDNNKIQSIEHFKCISTKIPNLKILHLANNKIQNIVAIEVLKQTNVVELVLTGNPVRDRFRDETVYVSEIRKRLPKLIKLDNVVLPPQIGFDVGPEDENKIPQAKASFLCDVNGQDIVRQFLEQYFIIYDSADRQPLIQAYHEHALFSMTASYNPNPVYKLHKYIPHSRNILRTRDLDYRLNHLKNGRIPIVSFLSELPQTEHDPQSFGVDLTLFSPALILLSVTGIFREKGVPSSSSREMVLRSFHRSLVIVPNGNGFCIKNDMLHVNTLTAAQVKTAFKPIAPAPVTTGPIQQPIVPTPTQAIPTASVTAPPDDSTKLQMIQAMSQHSQMNVEWSKKCLEETNWNFERAGFVFTELNKQGKIPAEAFIK